MSRNFHGRMRLRDIVGVRPGVHLLDVSRWRASMHRRRLSVTELRRQQALLIDFDATFYRDTYRDLVHLSEAELIGHWLGGGAGEGRIASLRQLAREYPGVDWQSFDAEAFLEANPDIPEMSHSATAVYYARYGIGEGRPRRVNQAPLGTIEDLARQVLPPDRRDQSCWAWRDLFRAVDEAVDSGFSDEIELILQTDDDRRFVVELIEAIHCRIPSPQEVALWQQMIQRRGRPFVVSSAVRFFARDSESVTLRSGVEWDSGADDPADGFRLLGDPSSYVPFRQWNPDRGSQVATAVAADVTCSAGEVRASPRVSVICSLYSGGNYIERYLQNITAQVGFDLHELVIVDAASPDGEREIIERYMEAFPNIAYHRTDQRIGIYEAWNLGIRMSRGEFITNANLDDQRHPRSLDDMAAFLDRNPEIDVVYTDCFYALEPHLPWEVVEGVGIRTDLAPITTWTILDYNSPHCAPMWRRSLHDELGFFDESFVSAGDWEFWVRCADANRRFHKLEAPRIGYYLNPEGISTRKDGHGIREQWPIRERYRDMLLRPEVCLDPLRADEARITSA